MISMLKNKKARDFCYASYVLMDCSINILPAKWLFFFNFYGLLYHRTWEYKKILRVEKNSYLGNTLQFSTQKHNALPMSFQSAI